MAHTTDKAEADFFHTLLGAGSLRKTAVDLEAETADLLGVPAVSPSTLDQLEAQAGGGAEPEPEAEQAQPAAPPVHPAMQPLLDGPPQEPQVDENAPPPELGREDQVAVEDEEAAVPEVPSRASHGRLFSDKLAHPIQIFEVLNGRYRSEWDDWEPETLWWAIRRDFGPVGDLTRNKIGALTVAVGTDAPWQDWDTFENCGLAWNDMVPCFGANQLLTPMQVAFTIQILRQIRAEEMFSNEVNAYIAYVLDENGWVYAPEEWFGDAQALLDRKQWLIAFKSDVANAWMRVRDIDPLTVDWNANDALSIHLIRMHVVKRYLDERALLKQDISGAAISPVGVSPPVP